MGPQARSPKGELAVNIGQAEVAARVSIREPLVVEPEQMKDRGVQVVDVNLVVDGEIAVVVGLAVGEPRLHSSTRQPHGVTVRVVVASVGSFAGRRSAELATPHHECFIPKPALAEVGQEPGDRLVDGMGDAAVVGL